MKFGKELMEWCRSRIKKVKQPWGILLIIGLLLAVIVWPTSPGAGDRSNGDTGAAGNEDGAGAEGAAPDTAALTYEEQLEEKLAAILSRVKGAGKVVVMITLESSSELVLQSDESGDSSSVYEEDKSGGSRNSSVSSYSRDTVLAGESDSPYVIKEINPQVSGVLVLAEGAGSAAVKNEIYEAVEALFNIPIHKIKVLEAENME